MRLPTAPRYVLIANKKPLNGIAPGAWLTHAEALRRSRDQGIEYAFVLTDNDDYFTVDIDNGRQLDGTWAPWVADICMMFEGAYRETSQSGHGIRIIGRTSSPGALTAEFIKGTKGQLHRRRATLSFNGYVTLTQCGACGDAEKLFPAGRWSWLYNDRPLTIRLTETQAAALPHVSWLLYGARGSGRTTLIAAAAILEATRRAGWVYLNDHDKSGGRALLKCVAFMLPGEAEDWELSEPLLAIRYLGAPTINNPFLKEN